MTFMSGCEHNLEKLVSGWSWHACFCLRNCCGSALGCFQHPPFAVAISLWARTVHSCTACSLDLLPHITVARLSLSSSYGY